MGCPCDHPPPPPLPCQAALAEAEAEASKHVLQSKQFVQLKKILERKNQQLQELRERLSKYESDQATEDD